MKLIDIVNALLCFSKYDTRFTVFCLLSVTYNRAASSYYVGKIPVLHCYI